MSDVLAQARAAIEDPDNLDLALHPAPLVRALVAEVEQLRAQVETLRRGGRELGRMVKRLSDDQLAAIGEEPGGDLIDTDGDGHWGEVWDRLMALRPERDAARAEVERLRAQIAAVQALADRIERESQAPGTYSEIRRAHATMIRLALNGEQAS